MIGLTQGALHALNTGVRALRSEISPTPLNGPFVIKICVALRTISSLGFYNISYQNRFYKRSPSHCPNPKSPVIRGMSNTRDRMSHQHELTNVRGGPHTRHRSRHGLSLLHLLISVYLILPSIRAFPRKSLKSLPRKMWVLSCAFPAYRTHLSPCNAFRSSISVPSSSRISVSARHHHPFVPEVKKTPTFSLNPSSCFLITKSSAKP